MPYPPRLAHLATKAVVVAKLSPTYADAHRVDAEEASQRLSTALSGRLLTSLLEATWTQMLGSTKRLKEEGLLEKVAATLSDRPQRPGKVATVTAGWSAFLILVDLEVGTASDAARRVMESDEGRKRAAAGLTEVAGFLAQELTRGK
ncbi:hypothetical protein D7W82_06285 [Corallococcus sp. CA049B]|uniref:hypothetical protein n=1 Tax=Corallococcus sp. CA049B TaxID=2316730 RepID=UPI000EA09042|nr:hypothetical protein [Corallococcus sp. CA049B]NOJ92486.1 hypothetical protein [Corallococcus coralloides]RKG89719.1 hypothetical protein D7W82_06285 [Corallococcus sp. CA049B]